MKRFALGPDGPEVPQIAIGCMRIDKMEQPDLVAFIDFCLVHDLNFFDHADIYGGGVSEEVFGRALASMDVDRGDVLLQSKCGIVPGKRYDFSREHILASVDGSLERLKTDYLDVLVLHRPDPLMDPDEVAGAFDELEASGKVRRFGVSNMKPSQIELLRRSVRQPLVCDQLQLSVTESSMVAQGMEVNMAWDGAVDRDGGILDYCRLNDIVIQAWSPLQKGFLDGTFLGDTENYGELNKVLDRIAAEHDVAPAAVAFAWVCRIPTKIQAITGTTRPAHLADAIAGANLELSRQEWYDLYLAAGHKLP